MAYIYFLFKAILPFLKEILLEKTKDGNKRNNKKFYILIGILIILNVLLIEYIYKEKDVLELKSNIDDKIIKDFSSKQNITCNKDSACYLKIIEDNRTINYYIIYNKYEINIVEIDEFMCRYKNLYFTNIE